MTAIESASRSNRTSARFGPVALFWVCGLAFYGTIGFFAAKGGFLDQAARDIWQHLAALRALIADPIHPANPFIPTNDPSRHFHPYWVGVALLARVMHWSEWQAYAFATFVNVGLLLAGIYAFGRAFYRDRSGPLALLAAMALGWIFPIGHTGYHSPTSYLDGFAYPASLLVSLSLILWALVIRALERPRLSLAIAPLAALMFATHQLGAGIGFILAGWLALLWPNAPRINRVYVLAAVGIGTLASSLWPYFNPFAAIFHPGNSTWTGAVNFYDWEYLGSALIPQAAGLIGLFHPDFRRFARPIVAALVTYTALFLLGRAGVLIATRFMMPAVLMLHIGLGALFLALTRGWHAYSDRRKLGLFAAALACVGLFSVTSWIALRQQSESMSQSPDNYQSALALTRDIPDARPVAAYDVAAWPVVATGQRALSEPWPEPGIPDLATRQAATERLFDPSLTRAQRIALARHWGVRTLVMHCRGALRRKAPAHLAATLGQQSVRQSRAGPFLRFDLY